VLGETSLTLLREQQLAVCDDVELAALALDGGRVVLGRFADLGRETRGPPVVAVSDGTVEDLDARHARQLSGVRSPYSAAAYPPPEGADCSGAGCASTATSPSVPSEKPSGAGWAKTTS
jgi:hypothetical protein